MNLLIIILNTVYLFLTKVRNQSPLFGAVTLVTILIVFSLLNIIGFYFVFKTEHLVINIPLFIFLSLLVFIILFFYVNGNKNLITERGFSNYKKKNISVLLLYLFTLLSTICLTNINREKISKQNKKSNIQAPKKKSLEGRIKKWLNE